MTTSAISSATDASAFLTTSSVIGIDRRRGHASRSMSMFPSESSVARQPGGTTQVESYSSTSSGPSPSAASRAARRADRPATSMRTRARRRSRRGACARPRPAPGSPPSGSYGASPFAAARAVSFTVDDVDRRVRRGVPVGAVMLGVEVGRDALDVDEHRTRRQRQLVGLPRVANVGEARMTDRLAGYACRRPGRASASSSSSA